MPIRILLCPACGTRVAPTQQGQCPACRQTIAEPEPVDATNGECVEAVAIEDQFAESGLANVEPQTSTTPYQADIERLRREQWQNHSLGQWKRVIGGFEVLLALLIVIVGGCIFPFNFLLALPLVIAARNALMLSRMLLMPNAHVLLSTDKRPPVLFLRSYQDDGTYSQNPFLETAASFHPLSAVIRRQTYEEKIAESAACVGPVVAVGKPGENLPELGAARMYLPHTHWQATVRELMEKSRLVVLRLGPTPGLAWELNTAITVVPPENLVIYREPPGPLTESVAKLFPVALPASMAPDRFIFFDPDWTPHSTRSIRRLLKYKRLYKVQPKTVVLLVAIVVLCASLAWFIASYL